MKKVFIGPVEPIFSTMKTEFEVRPAYVRLENRITAHFLIYFLALLVYRLLGGKLGGGYTYKEILNTLKAMNFADMKGLGYMPLYLEITGRECPARGLRLSDKLSVYYKTKNERNSEKK